MYLRVIRGQIQPGKADEFAKRWKEQMGGQLRGDDGFRRAYIGVNRDSNDLVGMSFWDKRPNADALNQRARAFMQENAGLFAGGADIQDYEVLVEL